MLAPPFPILAEETNQKTADFLRSTVRSSMNLAMSERRTISSVEKHVQIVLSRAPNFLTISSVIAAKISERGGVTCFCALLECGGLAYDQSAFSRFEFMCSS
jgi:hypothetical protein